MQSISLNGAWDFVVDLDPRYHTRPAYAEPNWDRRHWREAVVPGVWNRLSPEMDIFEGVCWYVRRFAVDSALPRPVARLRFGGVNYRCDLFLNGNPIGSHEGGYTEFVVGVSGRIVDGTNTIAVRVDNRACYTVFPYVQGYFNYGGIHRDVTLEVLSGMYLDDVAVQAIPDDGSGRIEISGRACGDSPDQAEVRATCRDACVEGCVASDGRFSLRLDVRDVEPWTPESPALYPLNITLRMQGGLSDRRELNVGFRSLRVEGRQITLNGRPVVLRGICHVFDDPRYGMTLAPQAVERDIMLMKEMGVNIIRSHVPFSTHFYQACDRLGMMLWIEPPIYCIHPATDERNTLFADQRARDLARMMLREMILHARNHASVVLYGIGNECNLENPEASDFFHMLAHVARAADPSRLLSYACLYGNVGPVADIVDIVGINAYWGWYDRLSPDGTPRENEAGPPDLMPLEQLLAELAKECSKPLLLTEFGADAVSGLRSERLELWSEDYQARLIGDVLRVAERHPAVRGTFPFCFADYRDPSKHVGAHWTGTNLKGMVTLARCKRRAYDTVAAAYRRLRC